MGAATGSFACATTRAWRASRFHQRNWATPFRLNFCARLTGEFRRLGFTYVTLDCEGYRTGSLNAELPHAARVS